MDILILLVCCFVFVLVRDVGTLNVALTLRKVTLENFST